MRCGGGSSNRSWWMEGLSEPPVTLTSASLDKSKKRFLVLGTLYFVLRSSRNQVPTSNPRTKNQVPRTKNRGSRCKSKCREPFYFLEQSALPLMLTKK